MPEDLGTTLEKHIVGLRRYAVSLLRDSIEADDLVQECLVRALSRAHVWPRVQDRRAYLFTILHNIYVDRRAQYRRHDHHVPIDDVAKDLYSLPNQNERLEVRDFKRALYELPENYRVVTLLVGLEGMSYRQAADVLGVPVGTVMSRLSRGREFLRRHMNGGVGKPANHAPKTKDESRHARPPGSGHDRSDTAIQSQSHRGNGNGRHRTVVAAGGNGNGNGSGHAGERDDDRKGGDRLIESVEPESLMRATTMRQAEAEAK